MATQKTKDPRRFILKGVRLSYCYLGEPQYDEDKDQYSYRTMMLIPKRDKALLKLYKLAIVAAAKKKFGGKAENLMKSSTFKTPLRDPENEDRDGEEYEGMYFANAKSLAKYRPGIVLRNGTKLTDPNEVSEEFYSGVYVNISLTAYGFQDKGSKGIALAINNVMKAKDGARLDGSVEADDEFSDMFEDDDLEDDGLGDGLDDFDDDLGL